MKTSIFSLFFLVNSITACTQEKKEDDTLSLSKTIQWVPVLTRQNNFVYTDKMNMKLLTNKTFKNASVFTPTGFAIVENEKGEYAAIDDHGKIVLDFSSSSIDLNIANGLTFYKKNVEYEKKMPAWKWDLNILGGEIKKEQTYHKIEIGILETKQVLLSKDLPYLEDNYDLNFIPVDENHIFWRESIYEIKKSRLNRIEQDIAQLLENKRFIKASDTTFSMHELNQQKVIHKEMKGTETLSIQFGKETIQLQEVNKERYDPDVPKLLTNSKTDDIYPFPQYDKPFPKEITKTTASQIDFIKEVSLVYSITDSPYFLLGVFNYDHDAWAYDWLYIDTQGNITDSIGRYNFKVLDQVGDLVWPDRKMILPGQFTDKNWKFGKINSYEGMNNAYLIRIEDEKKRRTIGLWNSDTKTWEIKPEYQDILVLDTEKQIYALQKEKDGLYILYDNATQNRIGSNAYQSIHSDGWVTVKFDSGKTIHYYIDIYSGKEYREI